MLVILIEGAVVVEAVVAMVRVVWSVATTNAKI